MQGISRCFAGCEVRKGFKSGLWSLMMNATTKFQVNQMWENLRSLIDGWMDKSIPKSPSNSTDRGQKLNTTMSTLLKIESCHDANFDKEERLNTTMSTLLKTESCPEANFVITGDTGGCLNDNLQCHHWWQSWHYDNKVGIITTPSFQWYYGIYSMLLPRNSTPVVLSNYTHTYILPFLPHRHLQWGVTYMTWAFQ